MSFMHSPMKKPLLRMFRCVSVAPLGKARGAAGELDVDRVGGLQGLLHRRHLRVGRIAAGQQFAEAAHAGHLGAFAGLVDPEGVEQLRQPLRAEFLQHAEVVAGLEARHRHQRLAADLVERVLELRGAVGGVDVDQDQARLRGRDLHQHPGDVVVRPDAHAVAGFEAELQQRAREAVRFGLQFAVAEAQALVAAHERLAVRLPLDHVVEEVADGLLDQRDAGITLGKTQWLGHGACLLLRLEINPPLRRCPSPRAPT
ncbi:hypothetical protein M2165_001380 [Variovorax sp. TBS-050B]|nr:hypothetical protein [Variovorax sp. TBS-050B]